MKVAIYSLGCKVNIYESEYVESLLKNHGYEIVPFDGDTTADIYIINTCSVTNESDRKSRKIIHQAKRKNDKAIIIVMGCYSQVKPNEIDADIVIGNKDKSKILEYINEYISKKNKIKKIYNLREDNDFETMYLDIFENHTRAFVKIQDGCNAFCSYCIIPYTRGKIRSKKFDDVVKEVTALIKNGYHEIVLTGIHTGKYGLDLENTNLEKLLRKLVEIPNLYRLRLSSIEINEITDGIMQLIKESKVIASHLHIPLQSGSNNILKAMNRRYTKEEFIEKTKKIKNLRNDISITTDLIVGFPGETEEDFQETIETIKKIGFTKIHTFPYSKREGTVASIMKNQIDGNVKKKRVKKIIELSDKLELDYYKQNVGKEFDGVSELKKDGTKLVHTSNFIPVIINDNIESNKIIKVKIKEVNNQGQVYGLVQQEKMSNETKK